MGIYISRINMPKGESSKLVLQIFPNGEVYDEHGIRLGITNWAEAIHVPSHGRLIDTDGKTFPTAHRNPTNDYMHGWNACLRSVQQQPTIIPIEEEKS